MTEQSAPIPGEEQGRAAEALLRAAAETYSDDAVARALDLLAAALAALDNAPAPPHADMEWPIRLGRVRALRLNNRAAAYGMRHRHYGAPSDLDEAITAQRASLQATPPSDPPTALGRARLAALLRTRFTACHVDADLTESLVLCRGALEAARTDTARSRAQSELSLSLRIRYEHDGDLAALDESIDMARAAAAAATSGTALWGGYQSNLSICLRDRFLARRHTADLDGAIRAARASLTAPAATDNRSARMANLAAGLRSRYIAATRGFTHHVDTTDIDEAIDLLRAALSDAAPTRRGWRSADLAAALLTRYDSLQHTADLDEAITWARAAVADTGVSRYDLALRTNDLGYALANSAAATGDPDTAAEAVATATAAVALLTPSSANHAMFHENLGLAHRVHFDTTGAPDAWHAAVTTWQRAATSPIGATMDRLRAARRWADFAERTAPHSATALHAHVTALNLLPRLAWHGIDRASQEAVLTEVNTLAGAAVASAIEHNHPQLALQGHEQSRAVLWSQLLHFRSDLHDLTVGHPTTAHRLRALTAALNSSGVSTPPTPAQHRTTTSEKEPTSMAPPHNAGHDERMAWAREWDDLIEHVRTNLDGFENFLRPLSVEQLLAVTAVGPVAVINIAQTRCDALLLTPEGVQTCPLPGLTYDDATAWLARYLHTLTALDQAVQAHAGARAAADRDDSRAAALRVYRAATAVDATHVDANTMLTELLAWLWNTIADPVLAHLGLTSAGTGRLWWCPTGPLTLLPLHAAGLFDDTGRTVMDRCVSSYTPTVEALVRARASAPPTSPQRRVLVVSPTVSGAQSDLAEDTALRAATPPELLSTLTGADATRDAVLAALATHPIVHFDCHGDQDLDDPSHGGLLLSDTTLSVLDIAARPWHGDFVGLAACKTAVGGKELLDEAITLTAALHYTGFRHVVGTLWSVRDADARNVFTDLYQTLTSTGDFDDHNAAAALHDAVRTLRDSAPSLPLHWAGFVHVGP